MPGRKYTEEQRSQFMALIDRGGSVRAAAVSVGVHPDRGYQWMRQAGLSTPRSTQRSYSPEEKAEFFRQLAVSRNVSAVAREMGFNRVTCYAWAHKAGIFTGEYADAKRQAFLALRREGLSRRAAALRLGVEAHQALDWDKGIRVFAGGRVHPDGRVVLYRPEEVLTNVRKPRTAWVQGERVPLSQVEQVIHVRYLSLVERERLGDLTRAGLSIRQVAVEMGRSPSTISRELRRNTISKSGYLPHTAHRLSVKRRQRSRTARLAVEGPLREYVSSKLKKRWSPELLREYPRMPATVIAQRVGWTRSITVLKDRVRELRPVYVPPDPASRTTYVAGERVQCDLWFPPVDVPLGNGQVGRPPVLVMAAGYSRMLFAVMIPSRQAADLIAGHWLLLSQHLGAVPRQLVWDNEAAVGSWRAGKPRLTEDFDAFRGVLGCGLHQCRPGDPEAKGIVERANRYLETSFLPGRTFTCPADFNTQLWAWLPIANQRIVRRIGCAPAARWETDKAAMLTLPPVPPVVGWRHELRLPRDHYVRVDGNDYSVDPAVVGRKVQVSAGLTMVAVTCGGRVVAEHERCWGRHQSITDPAHHAAALALAAHAHTPTPRPESQVVQERDLGVYDAAFGLIDGQVA